MPATAAAAASWSRCSGPHPRGREPGSGAGDAAVGPAGADGDTLADGAAVEGVDDGAGPGAAVQEASATAETAAKSGRILCGLSRRR
ncbi:hypothetical protein E2R57_01735 [Arthrobacter nitrophenolicus]|uniref:Uncharacterized protein n=1 Tax=Arthrobacter nitrophenolicus TaxID=683150 RepID=A0A4R5YDS2_9MICC|nr:hypothetical protein E2R57_01735 [Arthrobacter nitrophenolicus]